MKERWTLNKKEEVKEALQANSNCTRLKQAAEQGKSWKEMTGNGTAAAESCLSTSKARENCPIEGGRVGYSRHEDF